MDEAHLSRLGQIWLDEYHEGLKKLQIFEISEADEKASVRKEIPSDSY